eukprot:658719-Karenia_brevis.AAC.1
MDYVRAVWPIAGRAQHEVVVRCFEELKPFGETARFRWQPMAAPDKDTGEPDHVGTITAQRPSEWTTAQRFQWLHGTDAHATPHIRPSGLAPSVRGAGMNEGDTPRLYTTVSENTALYYARNLKFPFETRCDCG